MAEYLKIPEVAHRLDVSEKTARRYVKSGTLPSVFIGNAYRVREEDLETFLEEARVEPGKAPAPPSLEPTFNDVLSEERREREGLAVALMEDLIKDGQALEEDLKTSAEDWPLGGVYKFGVNRMRHDLLYEEISSRKQPSDELREAKGQVDALYARISALADQHMHPRDVGQWLSQQLFAHRRAETSHQREAAETTDAQDLRSKGAG